MRPLAVLVLIAALAGCNARDGGGPTTTTTSAPTSDIEIVAIDGRWPIPQARALALAGGDAGAVILGEASFGAAAARVAGLDARAAEILGGIPVPGAGEVVLTRALADALGAAEGAQVEATSAWWPPSHVTAAFEMERVRPCDPAFAAPLCSLDTSPAGEATLIVTIPPGSTDLRFHADVVELGPNDFPATWNGSFRSPGGATTPFSTSAIERGVATPPGLVPGPIETGEWRVTFTLDVNGSRAPGAIAGFITYRTLGFSPFEVDLLRVDDASRQTQLLIENATLGTRTLRVASILPDASRAPARALFSLDDARALLGVGEGNVTALVRPMRDGAADALAEAAALETEPALTSLRARPFLARGAPPAEGALVLWAPPGIDARALPPVAGASDAALVVEGSPPLLGVTVAGKRLADARVLSIPARAPMPWRLAPGALWSSEAAALDGLAGGPHLMLLSADLAQAAGVARANATYVQTEIDTALGPRVVFGMGLVDGGPSRAVWSSAAFLAAATSPSGARLVVPIDDGADRAQVEAAALAAWRDQGVAKWLG